MSLPPRGAWIEITSSTTNGITLQRRSPHGERGLKSFPEHLLIPSFCRSPHGERGLKYMLTKSDSAQKGRSPHGERGLKSGAIYDGYQTVCRSPHGERGLKYAMVYDSLFVDLSLPPRGAWIEIKRDKRPDKKKRSLPPRGAWIEINVASGVISAAEVAPPTGSVD